MLIVEVKILFIKIPIDETWVFLLILLFFYSVSWNFDFQAKNPKFVSIEVSWFMNMNTILIVKISCRFHKHSQNFDGWITNCIHSITVSHVQYSFTLDVFCHCVLSNGHFKFKKINTLPEMKHWSSIDYKCYTIVTLNRSQTKRNKKNYIHFDHLLANCLQTTKINGNKM